MRDRSEPPPPDCAPEDGPSPGQALYGDDP